MKRPPPAVIRPLILIAAIAALTAGCASTPQSNPFAEHFVPSPQHPTLGVPASVGPVYLAPVMAFHSGATADQDFNTLVKKASQTMTPLGSAHFKGTGYMLDRMRDFARSIGANFVIEKDWTGGPAGVKAIGTIANTYRYRTDAGKSGSIAVSHTGLVPIEYTVPKIAIYTAVFFRSDHGPRPQFDHLMPLD